MSFIAPQQDLGFFGQTLVRGRYSLIVKIYLPHSKREDLKVKFGFVSVIGRSAFMLQAAGCTACLCGNDLFTKKQETPDKIVPDYV